MVEQLTAIERMLLARNYDAALQLVVQARRTCNASIEQQFEGCVHKKTWGLSTTNVCDGTLQVARCDILQDGFSSVHRHQDKHNVFIVHQGVLEIRFWDDDGRYDRTVRLEAGDTVEATAEEIHQFYALTDVVCSEIYYTSNGKLVRWNDIHRFTENGLDDGEQKSYDATKIQLQ